MERREFQDLGTVTIGGATKSRNTQETKTVRYGFCRVMGQEVTISYILHLLLVYKDTILAH